MVVDRGGTLGRRLLIRIVGQPSTWKERDQEGASTAAVPTAMHTGLPKPRGAWAWNRLFAPRASENEPVITQDTADYPISVAVTCFFLA